MGFIYLTSFGKVEDRLLLACARNVRETFGLGVRISSVAMPPRLVHNPWKGQHLAGDILRYLSGISFPGMVKMLALVDFDLYERGTNFLFGEAEFGGNVAVVSVYRLRHPNERVTFERVFKEVNHELGHTFGLEHCKNEGCVMGPSSSLTEVDSKSVSFCKDCLQKLRLALISYL